jgi:SAM-dependent methyltransferase
VQDELLACLGRELASFVSPWEDASRRAEFIAFVLPRIAATLDLLPAGGPAGRLLELGSDPFAQSLCLPHVWPGTVTLANYTGSGERRGRQTLVDTSGTRSRTFEYDLFNVETDEFPYPDGTFDVVIFAEMIEHLAINPIWALAEIHRVLKPGGHLIVTTPNALSIERVGAVLTGRRPIVDHYSPAFGYGARHNREYASYELYTLLDETGFDVESMTARDLGTPALSERLRRAALRAVLRLFSPTSRRAHLFARARRRPVFRWRFPQVLFTEPSVYRCARHPWVEMGVNDTIQCEVGWEPLEELPDGGWVRRVRGVDAPLPGGSAILRGEARRTRVTIALRAVDGSAGEQTRVRVAVARRDAVSGAMDEPIGLVAAMVPSDRWTDLEIPLTRPAADGEHLLVNVTVADIGRAVAVRRIALT